MTRSRAIGWSLVAWLTVASFWLVTTRSFHPTWTLAVIVAVSLTLAYAGATYVNHLLLVPRYWRTNRFGHYAMSLFVIMAVFTALALAVIRASYSELHGPDQDPNGVYVHFGIDFFGMVVHVLCAAGVVWVFNRVTRPRAKDT